MVKTHFLIALFHQKNISNSLFFIETIDKRKSLKSQGYCSFGKEKFSIKIANSYKKSKNFFLLNY